MKRVVRGLKWARRLTAKPSGIPIGRARGQKALGVRYERAIGEELREAQRGVWFEFEDSNGHGFCQVDFLLPWAGRVLVIEAKYTWVAEAHAELDMLYLPVARAAGLPNPVGLVLCKRLVMGMEGVEVIHSVSEALGAKRPVLHWIGNGPLLRRGPIVHPTVLAGAGLRP